MRKRPHLAILGALAAAALVLVGIGLGFDGPTGSARAAVEVQQKKKKSGPPKPEAEQAPPARPVQQVPVPLPVPDPPPAQPALPPERIEADVSTRNVAVTSAFIGTEIVVFGSIDNSRQPSPEAGYYDVIVVLEGAPTSLKVRRKSNVAGLWINTDAAAFDGVPSYYAVASTRPLEEVADSELLAANAIGFDKTRLRPSSRTLATSLASEVKAYEDALIRLKQRDGLYLNADYGVAFIGRSLFRASIELPANIPVGPLVARVFLLREGALLSKYTTKVSLERTGIELFLFDVAQRNPLLYGTFAVGLAIACGFLASAVFGRPTQ